MLLCASVCVCASMSGEYMCVIDRCVAVCRDLIASVSCDQDVGQDAAAAADVWCVVGLVAD